MLQSVNQGLKYPMSGAEIGRRGQKAYEKEMNRLQYQALRKCTGDVLGASVDKISHIAGVEDPATKAVSTKYC